MMRIEAQNSSSVPRYAWFKNVSPQGIKGWSFDPKTGWGTDHAGGVMTLSSLNGAPLPAEETSLLLQPGETATFEVRVPHRPIPADRAAALARQDFAKRHIETRRFWEEKLASGAQIHLPEKRVNDMLRAGLLHLDLILYGREPDEPLAPSVGMYTPIGTESAPIILFLDSMGWHDVARRSLTFFLEKQHDSGFMQNYGDYELETAGALYAMGEHYRYTRDDAWVREIKAKVLRACEYILQQRKESLREDLRGFGYGMIVGKVGDPQDRLRQFMFNGHNYLALQRVAEMLVNVDPAESRRLALEAESFRKDIRTALLAAMARSPVVPLGDGSWSPSAPPWVGYRGPLALYADGGTWYTHGAINVRESVAGPLWLIAQEVFGENEEPIASFLLNVHNELFTQGGVAFSQPYYSQHPLIHLARGEIKPFLKAYYWTVAGMADRETYTFVEHFVVGGPHKTHEEAWFLLQTRHMLYHEDGSTLQILPGVPRRYLEDGKRIKIERAASYFGPLSFEIYSNLSENIIEAKISLSSGQLPKDVEIRIPHPLGIKAVKVDGGVYDSEHETVTLDAKPGESVVRLYFE